MPKTLPSSVTDDRRARRIGFILLRVRLAAPQLTAAGLAAGKHSLDLAGCADGEGAAACLAPRRRPEREVPPMPAAVSARPVRAVGFGFSCAVTAEQL